MKTCSTRIEGHTPSIRSLEPQEASGRLERACRAGYSAAQAFELVLLAEDFFDPLLLADPLDAPPFDVELDPLDALLFDAPPFFDVELDPLDAPLFDAPPFFDVELDPLDLLISTNLLAETKPHAR